MGRGPLGGGLGRGPSRRASLGRVLWMGGLGTPLGGRRVGRGGGTRSQTCLRVWSAARSQGRPIRGGGEVAEVCPPVGVSLVVASAKLFGWFSGVVVRGVTTAWQGYFDRHPNSESSGLGWVPGGGLRDGGRCTSNLGGLNSPPAGGIPPVGGRGRAYCNCNARASAQRATVLKR